MHEHPAQALLAVEVADSSLRFDREVKARLYAEANVPEYWVVDVVHRRVEVFRRPLRGLYQEVSIHQPPEKIAPEAFPDVTVALGELFPHE